MSIKYLDNVEERFWGFVEKSSSCWIWKGELDYEGYGRFHITVAKGDNRRFRSHRVSYEFVHGPIPKGLSICHSCDNPSCVNPDHLWVGTNRENVDDKMAKGRQPKGSKVASSKLTEEIVISMRVQLREEMNILKLNLADQFSTTVEVIELLIE